MPREQVLVACRRVRFLFHVYLKSDAVPSWFLLRDHRYSPLNFASKIDSCTMDLALFETDLELPKFVRYEFIF